MKEAKKNIDKDSKVEIFESLIFPMQKKWIVEHRLVRARKSVLKKMRCAFMYGTQREKKEGV